jgi:hypothetical protein
MRLRVVGIVTVLSSLALAGWALYEKYEMERTALSLLYLDSVTRVRNDLYLLSSLREGRTSDATHRLENLLDLQLSILRGCKFDLCAESTPRIITEALTSAEAYRTRFPER